MEGERAGWGGGMEDSRDDVVEDLLCGRSEASESRRWRRAAMMGSAPLERVM